MSQNHSAIAVYASHVEAEAAIKELQLSGFEMKKLSIIGRDYHSDEHVVGYYNLDDRMKAWGKAGAFWGGIWGFLFGSAFFLVPGLGPLLVGGNLVGWIVGALEGALVVGGLSIVGAALYSMGIPKDSIVKYETALKAGKFVLIAHGSMFDTTLAKEILHRTHAETLDHHEHTMSELRAWAKTEA
ncbi:MAG: general stress protein [Holophaga sp.]